MTQLSKEYGVICRRKPLCELNPDAGATLSSLSQERHLVRELARRQAREEREAGGSSDLAAVPGVPREFAACVALRESTDGAGSSNIYGILPSNGYSSGMGLPEQKRLFASMYARSGTSPWAPYDGC